MAFYWYLTCPKCWIDTFIAYFVASIIILGEFLFEDLPRGLIILSKIYLRSAGIVFASTLYCGNFLASTVIEYLSFTLVWIWITFRLCLASYGFYVLGRVIDTVFRFAIVNPLWLIPIGFGITHLPILIAHLDSVWDFSWRLDRAIRANLFKIGTIGTSMSIKKTVVINNTTVDDAVVVYVDGETQTLLTWGEVQDRVRHRALPRLDPIQEDLDEWETEKESDDESDGESKRDVNGYRVHNFKDRMDRWKR